MSGKPTRPFKMAAAFSIIVVSATISATPAWAGGSPKVTTENIEKLSNGLAWYAMAACLVGICVSASLWAMGSKGQNPGQELTGKKGLILCCTAAFFIGATPHLINFFSNTADVIERDAARMNISSTGGSGSGGGGLGGAPAQNNQGVVPAPGLCATCTSSGYQNPSNPDAGLTAEAKKQQEQQKAAEAKAQAAKAQTAAKQPEPAIPDLRNQKLCEKDGQRVACNFAP